MSEQKTISYQTVVYRARRLSMVKQFGGNCWACGRKLSRTTAHFAHRKPTGLDGGNRGSWHRLHDVMVNPTFYALLCLYCHEDYDGMTKSWRGQKNGK